MTWNVMSDFSISLPDTPGALARFSSQLREADVNLLGLWGYGAAGRNKARFYCVPDSAEQFRSFLKSTDLPVEEGRTFYLVDSDHGGALVKRLERIAEADINLRAIEAVSVEDKFGCFIWADQEDWKTLEQLLSE